MTILRAVLLIACMVTMVVTLTSKRYVSAALFFIASSASLVLLVSPRYGLSFEVVACATGAIAALVVIGLSNSWIRGRVVGWSMPFWSKAVRFQPPRSEDRTGRHG